MPKNSDGQGLETAVIHATATPQTTTPHATPLYMTSSFDFASAEQARALFAREQAGHIYSRYGNPNNDEFIQKICLLEKAEAGLALASGMSAVFTALAGLLNSGDHVLACRSLFSSTHRILTQVLPRWGIEHSYADIHQTESWDSLIKPNTRLCIVESPTNPTLDLIDIRWLSQFCRERNIILVVDNVFATPILQKPLTMGADLVMHSATKFIDGQGRAIGGVLVGDQFLIQELSNFARHTGPALSPFNAWLFSASLDTLSVRMERHCGNAYKLANWLEQHPQVNWVRYPYLPSHPQYELAKRQMCLGGGLVTFELAGGLAAGRKLLDRLQVCARTANLGDVQTLVTHPASTTHSSLSEAERTAVGISPGLVRISVGLEQVEDVMEDLAQALAPV